MARARHLSGAGGAQPSSFISGATDSSVRSQDDGPSRIHDGLGLGAGCIDWQRTDAGILRSHDDLRGAGLSRRGQDTSCMAVDRSSRAELSTTGSQSTEVDSISFARLPAATWVAANVSYLKDIDTFETRLRQIGPAKAPPPPNKESVDDPNPKRVPKKKRGKGGMRQILERLSRDS